MKIALVRGPYLRPSGVIPWDVLHQKGDFEIVAFESDPPRFDTSSLEMPVRQLSWPDGKYELFDHDHAVSKGLRKIRFPSDYLRDLDRVVTEFDVIHTSENFNLFSFQAARKTRGTDTKFVFSAGENIPYPPFQRNPLLWRMKRYINTAADAITTTTPKAKRALIHELTDHKKISVVPNCIDTEQFAPLTDPETDSLPLQEDLESTTNVLFVHGLKEQKGVPDLLDAWRTVKDRTDGCRLILVGDNFLNKQDINYIKKTESIIWIKQVPYQLMAELYNSCDICVLPSVSMPNNEEQFGMAILEAMSCSLPTIVTDVGGLPFVTEAGETSLVVQERSPMELADAVIRLLEDPSLRERYGQKGRKRAKTRFSKKQVSNELKTFYEELAD